LLELDIIENTYKQRKGSLTFGFKAASQKFNNLIGQSLETSIELPNNSSVAGIILPELLEFIEPPELLLYKGLFESVEDVERLNYK